MAPSNLSSLLYSGKTNEKAKISWSQKRFLGSNLYQSVSRRYSWVNTDKANIDIILGNFKQEMLIS